MKKSLITFCACVLLATQGPTANAAETNNTGEVSSNSYENLIKSIQSYKYNTIVLNKDFKNWDSISDFIKIAKADSVQKTEKANNVKEPVTKVEKAPESTTKKTVTEVEKTEEVTKEEATPATSEAEKAPVKEEATPVTPEAEKAPVKEEATPVTPEAEKAPVKEEATPVTQEQPKATETAPTQSNNSQTTQQQAAPVTSTSSDIDAIEAAVVELTNAERTKAGLQPLKAYEPLMASARTKSQDMKDKNYFSHTSPTYGSPFDQMKSQGISYKSAGENIAKGQRTAEEVVTAWMNSEGHRANILNPDYTHIGVGYVKDGNIWTQQFIKQ